MKGTNNFVRMCKCCFFIHILSCLQVPEERVHRVRLAAGSGLRSDVWKEFVKRFGRIKIREGYGLTEASVGFLNYTDEVGPIGRASYFNKVRNTYLTHHLDLSCAVYVHEMTALSCWTQEGSVELSLMKRSCFWIVVLLCFGSSTHTYNSNQMNRNLSVWVTLQCAVSL